MSETEDPTEAEVVARIVATAFTANRDDSPFVRSCKTADALLASDWLATREREAEQRGAEKALREAADEMWRIFLRLPHTPSPLGDYIQRRVTELRARADAIRDQP